MGSLKSVFVGLTGTEMLFFHLWPVDSHIITLN